MGSQLRKLIRWVIFAIFLCLLIRYIWNYRVEFASLVGLNYGYIFPVILMSLSLTLLPGYRYYLIVERLSKPVQFMDVFKFHVLGSFLNKIAPQSGVIYKAHIFGKNLNLGYSPFFSSLISFILLDLIVTTIICTVVIGAYEPELTFGRFRVLYIFLLINIILLSTTVIAGKAIKKMPSDSPSQIGVLRYLIEGIFSYTRGCLKLISDSRLTGIGTLIIITEILISITRLYFCFKLIGFTPEFAGITVFVSLSRASSILVITPGNLGFREFIWGYLSDWLGVGMSEGIFISLILRAVEFILLGCLFCLFSFLARLSVEKASYCPGAEQGHFRSAS